MGYNQYMIANELENSIRSRRALEEYFALKENNWYPKDSIFNTGFAAQVLQRKKKLLLLSQKGSPSIGEIKNCPVLCKENLLSLCLQNENTKNYIPDYPKSNRISKEFLWALLYHIDNETLCH